MMSSSDGGGQDFDLNLAPIIDCFTVLITYLLVSASFISLCVFDVGVAATGEAPPGAPPPEPSYSLSVNVNATEGIDIKVTGGKENVNFALPVPGKYNKWDFTGLREKMEDVRKRFPSIKEANVSADPVVKYREIMHTIEVLKTFYSKVYLGG